MSLRRESTREETELLLGIKAEVRAVEGGGGDKPDAWPPELRTRPLTGRGDKKKGEGTNPFRTAVPFWGQTTTWYMFEWFVPKTGLLF